MAKTDSLRLAQVRFAILIVGRETPYSFSAFTYSGDFWITNV